MCSHWWTTRQPLGICSNYATSTLEMDGSERDDDDDDECQQINFYEFHDTKGAAIQAYNFFSFSSSLPPSWARVCWAFQSRVRATEHTTTRVTLFLLIFPALPRVSAHIDSTADNDKCSEQSARIQALKPRKVHTHLRVKLKLTMTIHTIHIEF